VEPVHLKACARSLSFAVGAATALLGACVPSGLPETVLPAQNTYACQDGTLLRVAREPDGTSAIAATADRSVRLPRVDSALQEKYGDGATTLYLDGDRALLVSDSFVVAGPCRSTVPLPIVRPWQPS
jgi:membrane-bound inhibitor of C-type lysozyme